MQQKHLCVVKKILRTCLSAHKVYVFGSRATNKSTLFSDLDLCIEGEPLSFSSLVALKDAFSESDLPYFVDVVEKANIGDVFYSMIEADFIELMF